MKPNKTEKFSTKSLITRRDFIRTTGAGSMGIFTVPLIARGTLGQTPPSDTIRHAVIGTGNRGGGNHCNSFAKAEGCELVAVCDVDPQRLNEKVKGLPNEERIRKYSDFRKLLKNSRKHFEFGDRVLPYR